jgi:hypothetical protein
MPSNPAICSVVIYRCTIQHITELRVRKINNVCMRLLEKPSGAPVQHVLFERDIAKLTIIDDHLFLSTL